VIIVSDTTAISSLHAINQLNLLEILFKEVVIPVEVFDELKYFEHKNPQFKWTEEYTWLKTVAVKNNSLVIALAETLDEGEAAAIALTIELKADLLLIDEKFGRKIVSQRGLNIIGLLGVLELAKRHGIVTSIKLVLDDLILKANFRISSDLYAETLRLAQEL
jgi:predicted nucleic acid-binding protein